ncbi:DUF2254 family protein [Tumebacillus flagellatus]|uniref:DUF2254 domain-containing protein n=1 Tax=Tumebacillus flagellatus TaxID=1157490 RepID=A0A074LLN2_9BACL|nr:DUF2254 family protein [Tumebacillus flagellatus]KEO81999.1 hypothetical protein EL26_17660 [Tumebacillus flagellatus]
MRPSALQAPAAKVIGQLLLSWLLMGIIFRFTPPFFGGDLDTARNYLATLASTLATILALSVSVIMVAIQLTASKYTHRVLDFFVRFPYNASLLSFYLGTIVHAIYLMSRISDTPGDRPPAYIDQGMSADLLLLIACFFSLLIYLYHVIQLLKPETIVLGIQREYLASYRSGDTQTALDKIEQICDIAKKAVSEMDAVTADLCVENIAEMMHAAKLPSEQADDVLWYHERIVGQLVGIASIAFKERELAVSKRVLDELQEMGMRYAESGSLKAASTVLDAYALIVRNNLVGQQMMNMIQTAVESVFSITGHVVKSRPLCAQTRQFVLQSFRNLGEIGKLVLKSETYGHSFVAKCIVSHAFGQLLSTLISNNGIERMGLVKALLFEYMKLAKRLVLKSEIHDIVQITTWLRNEMIPYRHDPDRVYPYLYLYMLLTSSSLYLRRTDVVMLLVRAVGKYFAPDEQLLYTLCKSRIEIRHFYDYHEPERYLINMFVLWRSYHAYTKRYPSGPERNVELGDTVEDKELWRDLFDGMDPDEFLGQDALH